MRLGPVLLLVMVVFGCRRRSEDKREPPPVQPSAVPADATPGPADVINPSKLGLRTSGEADDRVRAAFPRGAATEDARGEIGTSPAPLESMVPDRASEWVGELVLTRPLDVAAIRAALPPAATDNASTHFVKAQTTDGAWEYVEDDTARGPYVRVAVEVWILSVQEPVPRAELDLQIAWARAFLRKLEAREPIISMTRDQALAKAAAVVALRKQIPEDDINFGLVILPPEGKTFAGRLVWDVVYSAGFRWGDGDYFHWVPSPTTDFTQGISIATSTGATYFMPEWIARPEGADVDDLQLSFDVARCWEPAAVFEVMVRSAKYMARRLGGTLVTNDLTPFDEKAARAKLAVTIRTMTAAGIKPGSSLALQAF